MIRRVRVNAFQCWRNQTVELDEGVNIFAGTSDGGKSALLRAVLWCMTNRPLGRSFVTSGCKEKECSVEIEFDDCVAERRLGKDGGYVLDGEAYKAVGKQIPEDVAAAMNIQPVNIQQQHDPPFLLSESPAEVARCLNEVADLQLIDTSLANAKKAITKTTRDMEQAESNIAKYSADLEEYEGLDELLERLEELEELERDRKKARKAAGELERAIAKYKDAYARVETIGKVPDLSKAEKLQGKLSKAEQEADELDRLIAIVEKQRKACKALKEKLAELESKMPDVCPTCGQEIK